MNKVIVVLKPKAQNSRRWRKFHRYLEKQKISYQVFTDPSFIEVIDDSITHIIMGGGDGTLHFVINKLLNKFPPGSSQKLPALMLIPMGTGNDFARAMGISQKPSQWIQSFEQAKTQKLDVGQTQAMLEQRTIYFITSLTLGFSALVAKNAQHWLIQCLPNKLVYLIGTLLTFLNHKNTALNIKLDGKTFHETHQLFNLNIANTKYYGGGMLAASNADPWDGKLNTVIMELNRWQAIRYAPYNFKEDFSQVPGVTQYYGKNIELQHSNAYLFQVDGEVQFKTSHLRVKLIPQALTFII